MALSQKSDLKNAIPFLLQSTTNAYSTLATGVLALDKLQRVSELLDNVICSLKEEHGKYEDLIKVLTSLAVQYKKLDIETKCHIRTVKEQAHFNTKVIEEAKQQLLKGNEIASYFVDIEATAKHSVDSLENLRTRYDNVIFKVKDCLGQAKAGYERNEHKADIAEKGTIVGILSGIGLGGGFAGFQVATKALAIFGVPGAVVGGVLGLASGCVVGAMAGGLPFATVEVLFRKCAEKFKILDVTLSQIDGILLENFEVLTEICRLLGKLKRVSKRLSDVEVSSCDVPSDCSDQLDETNVNFLIRLRFDEFKRASQDLEKNCDYLLDYMPLKSLGLLSINYTNSKTDTVSKSKSN